MNIDFRVLLIMLVIILISMVLHELAHGVVAYLLGDTTAKDEGRLTLNPFKHLDPIISILVPLFMYMTGGPIFGGAKPVPVDSRRLKGGAWGMALVAIAGPLTNFILAFLAFFIGHISGGWYDTGMLGLIFRQFVVTNLGFFVFNIIPIPPLDGSRILYAIAPDGAREVMEKLEGTLGIWLIFILIFIFGSTLSSFMTGAINEIYKFFVSIVV